MKEPSADNVRKTNMETLASAHAVYIEAARANFGEKGLQAMGEANRLHGLNLGEAAIRSGALKRGDPKSIFEFFDSAHPYFGFQLEMEKASNDMLDLKVTSCPWIDTFRALGAGEDICDWVCKMDEGIGQAVNPNFRMTLTKCMMRGDDHCIYRWEKE
jgi:hypothetical protein